MRQLEEALRQMAERAEPLPTEVLIARIETELGWAGAPWAVAESEEPTMVTRQQPDLEIPTTTSRQPSRRGPLLAAAAAVVVILVGVGIAFATGLFDSDTDIAAERLAVATGLADGWIAGWNAGDGEAVAELFTEDGTFVDAGRNYDENGREEIVSNVNAFSALVHNLRRSEDVVATEAGIFVFRYEYEWGSARLPFTGEGEMELDGELITHLTVRDEPLEE